MLWTDITNGRIKNLDNDTRETYLKEADNQILLFLLREYPDFLKTTTETNFTSGGTISGIREIISIGSSVDLDKVKESCCSVSSSDCYDNYDYNEDTGVLTIDGASATETFDIKYVRDTGDTLLLDNKFKRLYTNLAYEEYLFECREMNDQGDIVFNSSSTEKEWASLRKYIEAKQCSNQFHIKPLCVSNLI